MTKVLVFLKARAKAIAAVAAPFVVAVAAKYGLNVDVNLLEAAIASVLAGGVVHQVSNRPT